MYELPINIENLIHSRNVESSRIEYKSTWDEYTKPEVIKSITAFANDFQNLNGGYIIIGIECKEGRPILPPKGLEEFDLDLIQREIRGTARQSIDPEYQPVFFPVEFQKRSILILWATAGDNRPYQCPVKSGSKDRGYFIRVGSENIKASGDYLTRLLSLTAKIPFDDRRNVDAKISDISISLVSQFLSDIGSDLIFNKDLSSLEIFQKMRLVIPSNGEHFPRNISLLFFNNDPDNFFRGARVEIVQFRDEKGGDTIEEEIIKSPIHHQIKKSLEYLESLSSLTLRKVPGQAEIERTVAYPYEAMREVIVNALFHRSYEFPPEPTKIYLYPNKMEIISYPGPVEGINHKHLSGDVPIPEVPLRNRRVGEFLKELGLAEARGTGIPKIRRNMEENNSPPPIFEFDE